MVRLRDTWQSYLPCDTSSKSSSIHVSVQFLYLIFEVAFRDLLVSKMCHLCKSKLRQKSYGSWKSRRWSFFSAFFRRRSLPNGRCYRRTKSCMSYWSCSLSQSSKLADQLIASWEDSAHEGGCPGGKTFQIFSMFFLFSSIFPRTVDITPDVDFQRSWCPWIACDTLFLKVLDLQEVELGFERYGLGNGGYQSVFPCRSAIFRSRFRPNRGISWRSESCTLCLKVLDL